MYLMLGQFASAKDATSAHFSLAWAPIKKLMLSGQELMLFEQELMLFEQKLMLFK